MKTKQKRWIKIGTISQLILLSGCMTGNLFRSHNPFAGSSNDPIDRSLEVPENHSFNPQSQDSSAFKPTDSLKLPITPHEKEASPNQQSKDSPKNTEGPRIIPQGVAVPVNLQLSVEAAAKRQVGSSVTFRFILRNSGTRDAKNVQVESLFDDGFVFPGYPEKKITRSFQKIAAGTSQEFSLTLTADTVGKHCCQFRVTEEKREQEWKSVCVDFIPRQLQISLLGPSLRFVGNRVEYTLKVSNIGNDILNGTEMKLHFSDALVLKEASRGAKQHSGYLSWELGALKPGEGMQVQAEFECKKTNKEACVTLEAMATGLPETITKSCLEILTVKDDVLLHLSDTNDPINVGDTTSYIIIVENPTEKPLKQLQLTTVIPDQFRIVTTSSLKGEKLVAWKTNIQGSTITFATIPELKPFEKQQFQVQLKALRPGDTRFQATITSLLLQTKRTLIEFATVND